MAFKVPENYRITTGQLSSSKDVDGNNGAFQIPFEGNIFNVIASDVEWEHVSVSINGSRQTPRWKHMCFIKDLFWDDCDNVVQFHPSKKECVNNHSGCLHLWRKVGFQFPMPPSWMVGIKELGELNG
jgi:hypothetical protein